MIVRKDFAGPWYCAEPDVRVGCQTAAGDKREEEFLGFRDNPFSRDRGSAFARRRETKKSTAEGGVVGKQQEKTPAETAD